MSNRAPDFEAEVRFLTREEGGRSGPAVQGYRPDIHVDDDQSETLWMIWPRFIDDNGQELPTGTVIPQVSSARFYIVNDKLRCTVHRQWLREGVRFHLSEGRHRVAACRVTKIFGLHQDTA